MDDKAKTFSGISGGVFLIGLGIIFLFDSVSVWPWILVVIGASSLPGALAADRGWYGWQSFFWLVGLAILFYTGLFWPGILILIGVSTLVGSLTRNTEGSPLSSGNDGDDDHPAGLEE